MSRTGTALPIVIVGGGPAGLTAAIAAADRGARVDLCEQLDRPGAKLLASGGGRCNLTNTLDRESFMARFGRQGRFMAPALAAMDSAGLRAFLARLGVPTVVDEDGVRVWPVSRSAVTVQSALWRRCRELRVQVRLGVRATELMIEGNEVTGVMTESGPAPGRRVILAAGGRGYPELGGGRTGYEMAMQVGHEIIDPTPALVPLLTAEDWPGRCAGVALPLVRVRIDLPGQPAAGQVGELIFTHRGISGPAALDISAEVADLLRHQPTVPLRVEIAPDSSTPGQGLGKPGPRGPGPRTARLATGRLATGRLASVQRWPELFDRWGHEHGGKMLRTVLGRQVPARLAEAVMALAGVDRDVRAAQVSRPGRDRLASLLTSLPLTVTGTEGFRRAMVTRGGVMLAGVRPNTLQSRWCDNLYLAGELLDLAGPSGGFNLQWAFSSGWLAGSSAATAT